MQVFSNQNTNFTLAQVFSPVDPSGLRAHLRSADRTSRSSLLVAWRQTFVSTNIERDSN